MHFTGKERDSESNLDYFGARYDSSQYGRFMTPDWSGKPQGVPYANFGDPQSLNLYAYVENDPIGKADPEGHDNNPPIVTGPIITLNWMNAGFDIGRRGWAAVKDLAIGTVARITDMTLISDHSNVSMPPSSVPNTPSGHAGASLTSVVIGAVAIEDEAAGELNELDTLKPGPYAGESIPASGPRITASEQAEINRIGSESGCHTCGTKNPGTKSGNFVGDHQPATALNQSGQPQRLYPQCLACSRRQGGQVRGVQQTSQGAWYGLVPLTPMTGTTHHQDAE
jgi:RHS repeat-associated protein